MFRHVNNNRLHDVRCSPFLVFFLFAMYFDGGKGNESGEIIHTMAFNFAIFVLWVDALVPSHKCYCVFREDIGDIGYWR